MPDLQGIASLVATLALCTTPALAQHDTAAAVPAAAIRHSDGVSIHFDRAANRIQIYSTYVLTAPAAGLFLHRPITFADRQGIHDAYALGEEKAKDWISRSLDPDGPSEGLVEEVNRGSTIVEEGYDEKAAEVWVTVEFSRPTIPGDAARAAANSPAEIAQP